jgi:hypothetical protein
MGRVAPQEASLSLELKITHHVQYSRRRVYGQDLHVSSVRSYIVYGQDLHASLVRSYIVYGEGLHASLVRSYIVYGEGLHVSSVRSYVVMCLNKLYTVHYS